MQNNKQNSKLAFWLFIYSLCSIIIIPVAIPLSRIYMPLPIQLFFCLPFLLLPLQLALSIYAFFRKSSSEFPGDTSKSLISIFISGTMIFFSIFMIFTLSGSSQESTRRISCKSSLKQIALVMLEYAKDNNDSFPECNGFAGFKRLADTGYLTLDPKLYTCPSMHKHYDIVNEETVSYLYISGAKPGDKDKPLVLDKYGNHKHYGNLVYADGQIQTIEGNDWENLYNLLISEGKSQQGVPGS